MHTASIRWHNKKEAPKAPPLRGISVLFVLYRDMRLLKVRNTHILVSYVFAKE